MKTLGEVHQRERLENALIIFESDYCFDEKSMKLADIVRQNPDILYKFWDEALAVMKEGFDHYSAKTIVERLRWHTDTQISGNEYKIDNTLTTPLSYLFEIYDPTAIGFFKHTKRKGQQKLKIATNHNVPFGNDC